MNGNDTKKDNKIIIFIIGVLIGAVISTASFLISVNVLGTNNSNSGQASQMQGGTPPDMPSGGSDSQDNQPPAMPGSDSSSTESGN